MIDDLFRHGQLSGIFPNQLAGLAKEVKGFERDYLLNANEADVITFLVGKFQIDPIILHEDRVEATDHEDMIPAEHFPPMFYVIPGKKYPKQVFSYHLPFDGEEVLFKYQPSGCGAILPAAIRVLQGEIVYPIVAWNDNSDGTEVKKEWDDTLQKLRELVAASKSEVERFNEQLEKNATAAVQSRKAELLKQSNRLASLGVPLRKNPNVPATFAVAAPKKKVLVTKPAASTAPFAPEPTLDEASYHDLLKMIQQVGLEIERHPSIYQGKDEETLRDHLLMVLAPQFDSVTGETFNKTGKTDILIRHEGKNLFVAECGIWKGIKNFLGKIDQLLSYLTWRDSKTALICFVRNKEFSSVLETIKNEITGHANFVKENTAVGEAWLRYEFCLPSDRGRPVRLAVLCFHFPD